MTGPADAALPVPLVTLEGVRVTQGGATVLSDVTFTVRAGEAWLLTGPNGGGKSSLLGVLRGDLSPQEGRRRYVLEGEVRVSAVRARRLLPLVSPALEAWFLTRDWVQSVSDVLLVGLEGEMLRLREPDAAARARLAEVAALTGLEGLLERDVRTLSHGQRRRVLLGRALMPRPAGLLLDEFTDGLSVPARAELRGTLERVAASGVAVVLATHRPDEAPGLAWRHLRVEGGTVREEPLPPVGAPDLAVGGPRLAPAPRAADGEVLVAVRDAEVYRNGHRALGPLDWEWRRGQHWLVTGENGAGKSTLARLVAGEFHPALGGLVTRPFLKDAQGQPRDVLRERRRAIGVVGAELTIRQRRDWTGEAVLASAFHGSEGFAGGLTDAQALAVQRVAGRLGVTDLLPRRADTLSQGQLGRLLLARAVVHAPTLLVLDEALNFLDPDGQRRFLDLLPDLTATGTHLLVVAHREQDVPRGLTHHLHLNAGRVAGVKALTPD
ncbi:ATP-binding cassette domain-containing protein [Deinococcus aquiradiocola]|nr:ATP-binding cassette domain-containing protein [Deinococcus aquiradiocola]